ncbi:Glycine cleavage T protein (aminomethyltransferase) [gamma proteobacterium HdN1]|nr:Glycine cleavage T protein (aminomethyltransferase) [gamma proteobacterium HdN1]
MNNADTTLHTLSPWLPSIRADRSSPSEGTTPPLYLALGEHWEFLRISGPDAASFLQGQVTCDIREIANGHLRLGAHCTAKGRIQASFLGFLDRTSTPAETSKPEAPKTEPKEASEANPTSTTSFVMLLPPGMTAPTQQALAKYAMFAKVELSDASDAFQALMIGGRDAKSWCERVNLPVQETPYGLTQSSQSDKISLLDADLPLWLIITTPKRSKELQSQWPTTALASGLEGWQRCLSELGQAHIHPNTQDKFIPQELNYDQLNAINFKKGCYKGQEIIARLHFKGTPKYRTYRFQWQSKVSPMIGEAVKDLHGETIGYIVHIARTGEANYDVLLVTKQTALNSSTLQTLSGDTPATLTPHPLPNQVTSLDSTE